MRANIKLAFSKLTPVKLLALLGNVIAKLTGSTIFTAPPVSLPIMITLHEELSSAIVDATEGSLAAKKLRIEKEVEVQDALRATAEYQRQVANGNAAMLAQGGFELAKQPERYGVPAAPTNLVVRATNTAGELMLRWKNDAGTRGCLVFRTDQDPSVNANWTELGYTTRASYSVKGLQSYKQYWFAVRPIGAAGEGLMCDPAMGRAA